MRIQLINTVKKGMGLEVALVGGATPQGGWCLSPQFGSRLLAANIITLCLHTTVLLQQRPTPLKKLLFHLSKGTSLGMEEEERGSISGYTNSPLTTAGPL